MTTLWHGSGASPDVVAREGLRPLDPVVALAQLGVDASDSRVTDHVRRKLTHLWVYVTGDRDEAITYGRAGGNFMANVRLAIGRSPEPGWLYEIDPKHVGELRSLWVPPRAVRSVTRLSGEGIASEPRTALRLTKGSQPEPDAPSPDKTCRSASREIGRVSEDDA